MFISPQIHAYKNTILLIMKRFVLFLRQQYVIYFKFIDILRITNNQNFIHLLVRMFKIFEFSNLLLDFYIQWSGAIGDKKVLKFENSSPMAKGPFFSTNLSSSGQ